MYHFVFKTARYSPATDLCFTLARRRTWDTLRCIILFRTPIKRIFYKLNPAKQWFHQGGQAQQPSWLPRAISQKQLAVQDAIKSHWDVSIHLPIPSTYVLTSNQPPLLMVYTTPYVRPHDQTIGITHDSFPCIAIHFVDSDAMDEARPTYGIHLHY
jgi:hypothetical protein